MTRGESVPKENRPPGPPTGPAGGVQGVLAAGGG